MKIFRFFKKIQVKLITAFLLIGLTPLIVSTIITALKSSEALEQASFNQLVNVRQIKKTQIESFFNERQGDITVLVSTVNTLREEAFKKLEAVHDNKTKALSDYFSNAFSQIAILSHSKDVTILYERLKEYHDYMGTTPTDPFNISDGDYHDIYEQYGAELQLFQKDTGYYDVFLICAKHGHVMYSSAKESDLGENLGHGELRDSGLAKIWQKTLANQELSIVDFEPYAPSNNEPASFIGVPVKHNGSLDAVLVVQLSIDHINDIMGLRAGLGETGESYLVGPDKLMRSDSFLDPVNHSVKGSFANPEKGKVDTESVKWALAGQDKSDVVLDYNGNPVLSVAGPFPLLDLTWAILAEIDVAEAFNPVNTNGEEYYASYIQEYGYYDLFLINPDGYCFYTVTRESDLQTNFQDGKFASSNLGTLFREVMDSKDYGIVDFAPYEPSNGIPASFIAKPIVHQGEVEMVVALQLSLDAINNIMTQREGMGETGETYLVGPDKLMRSDSFLDPTHHTVAASFADPAKGSVDTEATSEIFSGNAGANIIMDYNGNPVLSAYTPVKIGSLDWGLIAEVDKAEALQAVVSIKKIMGLIIGISAFAIVGLALLQLKAVMVPINRVVNNLQELAQGEGDLTQRLSIDCPVCSDVTKCNNANCQSFGKKNLCWEESGSYSDEPECIKIVNRDYEKCTDCPVYKQATYDELQQLSAYFNSFVLKLQKMFKEVVNGVVTMSSATTELSAVSEQMNQGAQTVSEDSDSVAAASEEMSTNMNSVSAATEQVATNMNLVASAVEEMTSTISEVAKNTEQASAVTENAVTVADNTSRQIKELGLAAQEIGKVTDTIAEISEQTNLLALNATIEAARAGDAGKGFAVVANEIKDLAKQTAEATLEIKNNIDGVQSSTAGTVQQIEKIGDVINDINTTVASIAAAVEEQSTATREISENVSQGVQGLDEVNGNVAQSAVVTGDIARSIGGISQSSSDMSASSTQVQSSAHELSELAEKLRIMVGGFKL